MLAARRERIEQGMRDAEQASTDRESAEQERLAALAEARREANDILGRAQKVAQETRDADIAATRDELARMRERATEEITAEKQRALAELRGRGRRPRAPGGVPRRGRDHDRPAPAAARRGVPRRPVDELEELSRDAADGRPDLDRRPALRRGGLRARHPRQGARRLRGRPRPGREHARAGDRARRAPQPGAAAPAADRRSSTACSRTACRSRSSSSSGSSWSAARSTGSAHVAPEYRRLLNQERGIVEALATSAAPLTEDETDGAPAARSPR